MGSKYKEELEREWEGKSCRDMKIRTLQIQADRNLTRVAIGKVKRRSK